MSAQELGTLFNKANQHTLTFPSSVTTAGKTLEMRYSMTPLVHDLVSGPFTITATAVATDGSEVINNTKDFVITTTTKVYTIGFIAIDGTTSTQLNVGSATNLITTDKPAPTAASDLDEAYAKGIVDGIKDFAGKTSGKQTAVDAATSIVVTLVGSDGGTPKTITITVAAGDADDEAKVLAALATATVA